MGRILGRRRIDNGVILTSGIFYGETLFFTVLEPRSLKYFAVMIGEL